MKVNTLRSGLLFVGLAISTVGCDQLTKHVARATLAANDGLSLFGGLIRLTLAHNTGGFLSLGAGWPAELRAGLFVAGAALGLLAIGLYVARRPALSVWTLVGGALVCAGGVGNLLDRLLDQGRVTDFIIVGIGPLHTGVFNVADVAIMVGVGLFIIARDPHISGASTAEGGAP